VLSDLIRRFSWADDYSDPAIESWTVAVIEGRTPDEVVRVYGGDPTQPVGDYPFTQLFDLQEGDGIESLSFHLQVMTHDQYVIALENNGYTGAVPEIARRCSAGGGHFFAVHWSMTSNPRINEAHDGTVTAHVETYAGGLPFVGTPTPPWITGITIDLPHLRSTALALMEQQTGLRCDRDWLTVTRPTFRIPDPDVMLRDVPDARTT
jgi:hypothetical protein